MSEHIPLLSIDTDQTTTKTRTTSKTGAIPKTKAATETEFTEARRDLGDEFGDEQTEGQAAAPAEASLTPEDASLTPEDRPRQNSTGIDEEEGIKGGGYLVSGPMPTARRHIC